MIRFFNNFTKVTGFLIWKIVFRPHIFYEDKNIQSRKIKGSAIIISNHTSVYDFQQYLFVFFGRTLRFQVAEIQFEKKLLGWFLRNLGEIYVNRKTHNFSFMAKSENILRHGGVVGIFPESRIPLPEEEKPLPFKSSAAYLALSSQAPVIPVYTDGEYYSRKPSHVMIGVPMYADDFADDSLSDRENIERVTEAMRNKIIELGEMLNERKKESKTV